MIRRVVGCTLGALVLALALSSVGFAQTSSGTA